CLNTCVAASCGDGFTQAGVEACDDANEDNTDACLNTCVAATCGDGFTQAGVEACDDANAVNTDACIACVAARCGDGKVQAGVEACDDNNVADNDGCSASCAVEICGDGAVNNGSNRTPEHCNDFGIEAIAGNGTAGSIDQHATQLPAMDSPLYPQFISFVTQDNIGNIFFVYDNRFLYKLENGKLIRITPYGTGVVFSAGRKISEVKFDTAVQQLTFDSGNNLYFVYYFAVYKVDNNTGDISLVLNVGKQILSLILDVNDNVYFTTSEADGSRTLNKYDKASGGVGVIISGSGISPDEDQEGVAVSEAHFSQFSLGGIDGAGKIYVIDYAGSIYQHRIRRIDIAEDSVTTVVGGGAIPYATDGILATDAKVGQINGNIKVDLNGNVLFRTNNKILRVNHSGLLVSLDINGQYSFNNFTVSKEGNLYYVDTADYRIKKLTGRLLSQIDVCETDIINSIEQCDDGNTDNTDTCTNTCKTAVCGDGFTQADIEACDDGNAVNTDACTSTCRLAACGDTYVQAGEECDDGNLTNADGCQGNCKTPVCGDLILDAGEQCDDGNLVNADGCQGNCKTPVCGDFILDVGEQCDDGNRADADGCQGNCNNPICGDAITDAGEACDDGNQVDTDACRNTCVLAVCGDGVTGPGESCDDGNQVNTDQCTNACTNKTCGDGFVFWWSETEKEGCDDGGVIAGDGCSASCVTELCGDGVVNNAVKNAQGDLVPTEFCDDGNQDSGDGCSASCVVERCGDGVTNNANNGVSTEECDDGNNSNTDTCLNTCVAAGCGDGFTGPGEQCDDGNLINADGCQANCKLPVCGDAIEDAGEECDDGNIVAGDGCSASCVEEYCGDAIPNNNNEECDVGEANVVFDCGYTVAPETCERCGYDCTYMQGLESAAYCGDGNQDPAEECDDGNTDPDDGCSSTCKIEGCGDGVTQNFEECDDGNITSGDGCQADCMLPVCGDGQVDHVPATETEPAYDEQCDGSTESVPCDENCTFPGCGNGIFNEGEECEDGNIESNDGCSASCMYESCGDGVTQADEECDNGEASNSDTAADACRLSCVNAACGDGVVDSGEECDDGNEVEDDGCDTDCSVLRGVLGVTDVVARRVNENVEVYFTTTVDGRCKITSPDDSFADTSYATPDANLKYKIDIIDQSASGISTPFNYKILCIDSNNAYLETSDLTYDPALHDKVHVTLALDGALADGAMGVSTSEISGDGRHVVFASQASSLTDDAANTQWDIFVHDLETGEIEKISVNSSGEGGDGFSYSPSISNNGRFVAFESMSSNFVSDYPNSMNIYIRDRENGTTQVVNVSTQGVGGTNPADRASISGDGRFVVFRSSATELVLGTSGSSIFIRDLEQGTTEAITWAVDGRAARGDSNYPKISHDGNYVVYASVATNLVLGDTNGKSDVFLFNRATGETKRISNDTDGADTLGASNDTDGADTLGASNFNVKISGDGRYIAYAARVPVAVQNYNPGLMVGVQSEIVLYDTLTNQRRVISLREDGERTNHHSFTPEISGHGRYIVFDSMATDLVSNGQYNDSDSDGYVYVYDQVTQETAQLYPGMWPSISQDGRFITFESYYTPAHFVPWAVRTGTEVYRVKNPFWQEAVCGDGHVNNEQETCDDGNLVADDGCSATCALESGWVCEGTSCHETQCGDGNREGTESCDDGDMDDNDGCSATCALERGWICNGSQCSAALCGDGIKVQSEICDEGQLNGTPNKCNTTCSGITAPVCNNGQVEQGEQCDDGNPYSGDGCDINCKTTGCGSGIVTAGEECDDGNTASLDGCDSSCQPETMGCFVNTVAGNGGAVTFDPVNNTVDFSMTVGGQATAVPISYPLDVAYAANGDLYVSASMEGEYSPSRAYQQVVVWKVSGATGEVSKLYEDLRSDSYVNGINRIVLSADGRYLYGAANGIIYKIDVESGAKTEIDLGSLNTVQDLHTVPGIDPSLTNYMYPPSVWPVRQIADLVVDSAGNMYASAWLDDPNTSDGSLGKSVIFKVDPQGGSAKRLQIISGTSSYSALMGMSYDSDHNILYVFDGGYSRILRIALNESPIPETSNEVFATAYDIAGNGTSGYSGDGGPALSAAISVEDMELDHKGYLYFTQWVNSSSYNPVTGVLDSDASHVVRRINLATGVITTVAGTGLRGFAGDGGEAAMAQFNTPSGLSFDSEGRLAIADHMNSRVRQLTCVEPTACGDGLKSGSEACDDGNTVTETACAYGVRNGCNICTADCSQLVQEDTTAYCGDTVQNGPEQCDDGDTEDGDGCDTNCTTTACGNGVITSGEQCDDGNVIDGDGCDSNCTTTRCGNGIRTGTEQCDDGGIAAFDGCNMSCMWETKDYWCPGPLAAGRSWNTAAYYQQTCNASSNGQCTSWLPPDDPEVEYNTEPSNTSCRFKCSPGYAWDGSDCINLCGNGTLDTGEGEICDDGNAASGDGCSNNCTVITAGWVCPQPGTACTAARCGDGITAGTEACDDGNITDGDGCTGPTETTAGCVIEACGDGVVNNIPKTDHCDDRGMATVVSSISSSTNSVATDSQGNLYYLDVSGRRVKRVTPLGVVSIVVSSGLSTSASAIAIDRNDVLHIADKGYRQISKFVNGAPEKIAGTGNDAYDIIDGTSTNVATATAIIPERIAFSPSNELYFVNGLYGSDAKNIYKITSDKYIKRVAGNKNKAVGFGGEGVLATDALFGYTIESITFDPSGNLFIADRQNSRIRYINMAENSPEIYTLIGSGSTGYSETTQNTIQIADVTLGKPVGLAIDNNSKLYLTTQSTVTQHRVLMIDLSKSDAEKRLLTVAGTGGYGSLVNDQNALLAQLYTPTYLTTDPSGKVFVVDKSNYKIRSIAPIPNAQACIDALMATAETCDDHNQTGSDGCSATCKPEPGWTCSPGAPCSAAQCGDGITAGAETCDDGVNPPVSGDGCSEACAIESGFTCTEPPAPPEAPSLCVVDAPQPGDSTQPQPGDTTQPPDCATLDQATCETTQGCSFDGTSCAAVVVNPQDPADLCGDGVKGATELCDDGNLVNNDACSNECTPASCGDEIVQGICDSGDIEFASPVLAALDGAVTINGVDYQYHGLTFKHGHAVAESSWFDSANITMDKAALYLEADPDATATYPVLAHLCAVDLGAVDLEAPTEEEIAGIETTLAGLQFADPLDARCVTYTFESYSAEGYSIEIASQIAALGAAAAYGDHIHLFAFVSSEPPVGGDALLRLQFINPDAPSASGCASNTDLMEECDGGSLCNPSCESLLTPLVAGCNSTEPDLDGSVPGCVATYETFSLDMTGRQTYCLTEPGVTDEPAMCSMKCSAPGSADCPSVNGIDMACVEYTSGINACVPAVMAGGPPPQQ
ncbi:MAG: DUF4215 domain-containing protein, partial [Deltaproteobacteria bacterium]|nr:DUF4215 domain-containing protein [Deltaproteobacteria bacterium]